MKKTKVLMTGAGAPGGPGIIKALKLGDIDLHVGDANEFASGRFLNDIFFHMPSASDKHFIDIVLTYCKINKIEVIFPLVTRELFEFSKNKEKFSSEGIQVIVSDYDSLNIANNKSLLCQHLFEKNIVVPDFKIVNTVNELELAAQYLGYPDKSICIKPSVSNGSRGVRILDTNHNDFDLLFNHKPTAIYSTLNKIIETLNCKKFPELLVSEYLPGDEFTIDTLVHDGVPKLIIPRIRTKMNAGISVQGTFINHQGIIEYCKEIICSLNLNGPIGIQVKADENGKYKLLEINPRIQGTSTAALGLGINLPLLCVQQEIGEVDYSLYTNIKWGTSFARYYDEIFY